MGLTRAELRTLLLAWRDADESVHRGDEVEIAEALTAWANGTVELDEELVYFGIDFMASYVYRTEDSFGCARAFFERAATIKTSVQTECASRGYLLTLYSEISQVPRLSQLMLSEGDPSQTMHCLSALKKAILLGVPGIGEALKPLLSSPALDPFYKEDLQGLVFRKGAQT